MENVVRVVFRPGRGVELSVLVSFLWDDRASVFVDIEKYDSERTVSSILCIKSVDTVKSKLAS